MSLECPYLDIWREEFDNKLAHALFQKSLERLELIEHRAVRGQESLQELEAKSSGHLDDALQPEGLVCIHKLHKVLGRRFPRSSKKSPINKEIYLEQQISISNWCW